MARMSPSPPPSGPRRDTDRGPASHQDQARSFGAVADTYDRVRPGYPAEVVRWALGTTPCRVLDLGAGTGTLTRTLLAEGHEVLAVEPDPLMRARLAATAPAATVMDGTAEALPLPDASVDAVTVAQAWHWMDADAASAELARTVRPGGCAVLLWNLRDLTDPLSQAITAAVVTHSPELAARAGADGRSSSEGVGMPDDRFRPDGRTSLDSSVRYRVADLVDLVGTWSYVALSADREAIREQVREAAAGLVDRDGTVRLAQTVEAFRFRRDAA